jgi:hypothetical protein
MFGQYDVFDYGGWFDYGDAVDGPPSMADLASVSALISAPKLVCQYDRCRAMSSQIRCRIAED